MATPCRTSCFGPTVSRRAATAADLLPALRAAGVRVHTPALPPLPVRAEFVVERFELPAQIRANVPFPVAVRVQTTAPATVALRGAAGNEAPPPVERALPRPDPHRDRELRVRQGGPADLALHCDVVQGGDRFASNNQLRARVIVQARRGSSMSKVRRIKRNIWRARWSTTSRSTSARPMACRAARPRSALSSGGAVRCGRGVSAAGVPLLTDGDMRNLDAYVRQGGGLLVLGGENSLGSGGYQDTYFDKVVLPVRMDVESTVQRRRSR